MPIEDWISEAREAVSLGYTNYKMKARPWFDLVEQVKTISEETPDYFEIDLDLPESIAWHLSLNSLEVPRFGF